MEASNRNRKIITTFLGDAETHDKQVPPVRDETVETVTVNKNAFLTDPVFFFKCRLWVEIKPSEP